MTIPFESKTLSFPNRKIAYRQDSINPNGGVIFLPGFFSDMTGTKASFLAQRCHEKGIGFTRFDYRGHGASSEKFIDGCIGDWLEDALAVFDEVTSGPQIVVGSSMGGWIMLLLALRRPERVKGLVGIAAAPDFTKDLVWDVLSPEKRQEMKENGVIYEPSDYGDPLPYTLKLVEEGQNHLLLEKGIDFAGPVRLLHGQMDKDVPWQTSLKIMEALPHGNVRLTLVKDGDHPLSRPDDLELLWREVEGLASCA